MSSSEWPPRRAQRGDLALITHNNDVRVGIVIEFFDSAQYTPANVTIYCDGQTYIIDEKDIDVVQGEDGITLKLNRFSSWG